MTAAVLYTRGGLHLARVQAWWRHRGYWPIRRQYAVRVRCLSTVWWGRTLCKHRHCPSCQSIYHTHLFKTSNQTPPGKRPITVHLDFLARNLKRRKQTTTHKTKESLKKTHPLKCTFKVPEALRNISFSTGQRLAVMPRWGNVRGRHGLPDGYNCCSGRLDWAKF